MKYSENTGLIIKVFESLFEQIMDGLNFGHIYDDCMAIWKCLSTSRRVFITVSFSPAFKEKRKDHIESFDNCNTVSLNWSSLSFSLPACFKLSLNYTLTGELRSWLFINMSTLYHTNMLFLATWITLFAASCLCLFSPCPASVVLFLQMFSFADRSHGSWCNPFLVLSCLSPYYFYTCSVNTHFDVTPFILYIQIL